MKTIVFRPLRRVKKTGKITVAAYAQWRKIVAADTLPFQLAIDREYDQMPADEHVYDHTGQPLFWRDFDPARIPVFEHTVLFDLAEIRARHENYAIRWSPGGRVNYSCSRLHLDCSGVPCFSHYSITHVAEVVADVAEYEPLTVGMVVKWFGWFVYQLENVRL